MQTFINAKNRAAPLIVAAVLVLFSVLMASLSFTKVSADQLSQRKITISSSQISAATTTYAVSFRTTQTTIIRGLVVEICQNSPLIGAACTTTNGVTASPTTGTVTFTNAGSTGDLTFEVHANSLNTGRYIVTDADGATGGDGITPVTTADFTFSFTATNPSGTAATSGAVGTFYARILTYGVAATAAAYVSATPGTHLDDGGVALSTARRLTVNARVQEELEFCIGVTAGSVDTDIEAPANCSAGAFTGSTPTVDIGVISSVTPVPGTSGMSPVPATAGGNDTNGAAMIRTNAITGASITYFAVQDGATGGRLKVSGVNCNTTGGASSLDVGSGNQDQCFNSNADQDDANNVLATAGEKFGMNVSHVLRPSGSTTTNLTPDGEYNGPTTPTSVAWNSAGSTTAIASSTTVLDYEMLLLRFAARTAATTPTGAYTSLSNYVATGTF